MRLKIDTTDSRFLVTKVPEIKLSFDTGAPRLDPATGLAQYVVQMLALDESGGEILNATVVGDPKLSVTQQVSVTGLVAIPWSQGDRSGLAFRAASITPADTTAATRQT